MNLIAVTNLNITVVEYFPLLHSLNDNFNNPGNAGGHPRCFHTQILRTIYRLALDKLPSYSCLLGKLENPACRVRNDVKKKQKIGPFHKNQ